MGRIFVPFPQDEIVIARFRPRRKTRHQYSSCALRNESFMNCPGRRAFSFGKETHPAARHILEDNTFGRHSRLGAQIDNVFAIDIVRTQHAWVDAIGQPLVGLLDRRHDAKRQIKRRHPLGIKPGAANSGTVAGNRLKGPAGIMRAIARPDKSQAKPPTAK